MFNASYIRNGYSGNGTIFLDDIQKKLDSGTAVGGGFLLLLNATQPLNSKGEGQGILDYTLKNFTSTEIWYR